MDQSIISDQSDKDDLREKRKKKKQKMVIKKLENASQNGNNKK